MSAVRGAEQANPKGRATHSGVQSVDRALDVLEVLVEAGESLGLSQLAAAAGLPLPTVHRLLQTLAERGYVRRDAHRYSLGPRLVWLGDAAGQAFGVWARPALRRLVELTGETANLAILDGDTVAYIAQVQSQHTMRMFTEPGHRVHPHCTGVGKAMMSQLPPGEVRAMLRRIGMPRHTDNTITDVDTMLAHLQITHQRGFAVDDGEQEVGVRCVAVPLTNVHGPASISVSGPAARISDDEIKRMVPILKHVARELGGDAERMQSGERVNGARPRSATAASHGLVR